MHISQVPYKNNNVHQCVLEVAIFKKQNNLIRYLHTQHSHQQKEQQHQEQLQQQQQQ